MNRMRMPDMQNCNFRKDMKLLGGVRTLFHELALDPARGLSTRPLTSCSETLEVARVPGGSFLTCRTLYDFIYCQKESEKVFNYITLQLMH